MPFPNTTFVSRVTNIAATWLQAVNDFINGFPDPAGQTGKVIGSDGADLVWLIPSGGGGTGYSYGVDVLYTYVPEGLRAAILDGTSTDDHTAYIQKAINDVSNTGQRVVMLCGGKWNYTRLYGYYDAILNPDFNIQRDAEFTLWGEGIDSENGGHCGTILYCTSTTGSGFLVTPAAEDTSPFRSRDFRAENISFQGAIAGTAGVDGYILDIYGCPGAVLANCEVINTSPTGNGCRLTSTWFGGASKLRINCGFGNVSTGDAVTFGISPGTNSGLATFTGFNTSGFAIGFHHAFGGWQNVAFYDSEIAGTTYGYYCEVPGTAATDSLFFYNSYWEGTCTSFIAHAGQNSIRNLYMFGGWMYALGCTGPMIDLDEPSNLGIHGIHIQDARTAFLNITAMVAGSQGGYWVDGIDFSYPAGVPAGPTYTLFTGILPAFGTVEAPFGNPQIILHAAANTGKVIKRRANYAGGGTLYANRLVSSYKYYPSQANGAQLYLAAEGYPQFVWINTPAGTSEVLLPLNTAGLPGGFSFTITNSTGSAGGLAVKSETGPTLLRTLAVGAQHTFVFYRDTAGAVVGWG